MSEKYMKIGIDPGLTGAIAFLHPDGGAWVRDMPLKEHVGEKKIVDGGAIAGFFFSDIPPRITARVYIEQVQAMPPIKGKLRGAGTVSSFNFGYSAGVVEGVVSAVAIPRAYVWPQTWKKRAGLTGKPKDASRELAIELYPQLAEVLKLKKHHGRADALLIARFGGEG